MFRLATLALAALPATAAAQFYPTIGPPNPLYQHPAYRFQFSIGPTVPTMFGRTFVGMTAPATRAPQLFSPNLYTGPTNTIPPSVPWTSGRSPSGYMSGGVVRADVALEAQRAFEKIQRDATAARLNRSRDAAKDAIFDQWAYERLGVFGGAPAVKVGVDQSEELAKALAGGDEEAIASGDHLNHILVAVVAAEAKGGKGNGAHLGPEVLDAVRFSGSPAADAVSLVREAGRLPFPAAFDSPKLKDARNQLDADFAAAVAPLRDGKSADAARLAKVGLALQRMQEAATPVLRELPFEESTAGRRFLNRFEKALPVLRGAAAAGLVSPTWAAEGTSPAELVRHMHKHKLLFGPADEGGTDAYLALHRALANYLVAITQPAPKK